MRNAEWEMENGDSLKWGIFKSGNLFFFVFFLLNGFFLTLLTTVQLTYVLTNNPYTNTTYNAVYSLIHNICSKNTYMHLQYTTTTTLKYTQE